MPGYVALVVARPPEVLPTPTTHISIIPTTRAEVGPRHRPQRTLSALGHRPSLAGGRPGTSPPDHALTGPGLVTLTEGCFNSPLLLGLNCPGNGSGRPLWSILLLLCWIS